MRKRFDRGAEESMQHQQFVECTRRWCFAAVVMAGGFVASGLLLSGCSAKEETAEAAPTVTVQVGAAENETIQRKVNADAILYPLDQAALVPKIAAPVKKFYVNAAARCTRAKCWRNWRARIWPAAVTDSQGGYRRRRRLRRSGAKGEQDLKVAKQTWISSRSSTTAGKPPQAGSRSRKRTWTMPRQPGASRGAIRDGAEGVLDVKVAEGELNSAKGKSSRRRGAT